MIKALFIARQHRSEQSSVETIELNAAKGIMGDRHYDKHNWPGQNLTLIESEQISLFNQQYQQNIALSDTRRNIVTSGVQLNKLVGKQFTIGDALLYGVELCQPCRSLAEALSDKCSMTKHDIIKAFTDRGGLRASVIIGGTCRVDMPIHIIDSPVVNEQ
jgi:MOSC domain-containing protein YiiM